MYIQKLLRRKGSATRGAGNCDSLVVLRSRVGVVGAWINPQLGSVLRSIVHKHLLELQDIFDGPAIT